MRCAGDEEMLQRAEFHAEFVRRSHLGEPPKGFDDLDLDAIEQGLDTMLPVAFRQFVRSHGAVHTDSILDALVERELNHPDIQEVLSPEECVANTKGYWSAGMPRHVIGI